MILGKKHINRLQVVYVSMLLEFLSDFRSDVGDWHVQGVHGLDLGALGILVSQRNFLFQSIAAQ